MNQIIVIGITAIIGLAVAWAGGQGGSSIGGSSVFLLCAMVAFGVNWLAFVPANIQKTEKYYDLTGSLTYLSVLVVAVLLSAPLDARALLVTAMVAFWAIRLGSFLFLRIRADGHDVRFAKIKTVPLRFLVAWTLQGLWVILTAASALVIITSANRLPLDGFAYVGAAIWLIGFAIEVIADRQKRAFRKDPANQGRFIASGLWAWSRHPNYFGEIMLWTGITIMSLPLLSGWQWVTLISPIFVTLLLTRVSGIPMLEAGADKKWADDPAYQAYKRNVPVLIPRPPKAVRG
jgi:steroid 5-alpha reductase family enzyme